MYCPACNKFYSNNTQFCTECGLKLIPENPKEKRPLVTKKRNLKKPLIFAGILLVLLASAIGGWMIRNMYLAENSCAYALKDISDSAGTLVKISTGQMENGSGESEKYLTEISEEVLEDSIISLTGGKVLYETTDRTLYISDGKHSPVKIAGEVSSYLVCEKNIYFTISQADGSSDLYLTRASKAAEAEKIDSGNISGLLTYENTLIYRKAAEQTSNFDVYQAKGSEISLIKENVAEMEEARNAENQMQIYMISETSDGDSLYNYVDDSYELLDQAAEEPDPADYEVQQYKYTKVEDPEAEESDYEELYTTVSYPLYWYRIDGYAYSMEEAMHKNWGDNNRAVRAATQAFIDTYGSSANSNGLIKVDDEVKKALQTINSAIPSREENEWVELCMYREKIGSQVNEEYETDLAEYTEAQARIALRNEIQNTEIPLVSLSVYDGKEVTEVDRDILAYEISNNCLLYNKKGNTALTFSMEEGESILNRLSELTVFHICKQTRVYTPDAGIVTLESKAVSDINDLNNSEIVSAYYSDGNYFYALSEKGSLIAGEILSGNIRRMKNAGQNASAAEVKNGHLYFYNNYQENCGDFCIYSDEEAVCKGKNISGSSAVVYEDGKISALKANGTDQNFVMISESGKENSIASAVTCFTRTGENTYLYLVDGTMYFYNGEEIMELAGESYGKLYSDYQ